LARHAFPARRPSVLILGIVYRAAGLSSDYGRARFRLWVRQRGWEDAIIARIVETGLDPDEEFDQYLVSPEIADAVWELSKQRSEIGRAHVCTPVTFR